MEEQKSSTNEKAANMFAAFFRIALGWVFLWGFLDKLFGLGFATVAEKAWLAGNSPTAGFLKMATKGPFVSVFHALSGSAIVDWLFMVGLFCLGVALILGIGLRIAAYSGSLLFLLMWLSLLPPANNPIVDEHIIYIFALLFFFHSGLGRTFSLHHWWSSLSVVQKHRWLE